MAECFGADGGVGVCFEVDCGFVVCLATVVVDACVVDACAAGLLVVEPGIDLNDLNAAVAAAGAEVDVPGFVTAVIGTDAECAGAVAGIECDAGAVDAVVGLAIVADLLLLPRCSFSQLRSACTPTSKPAAST